MVMLIDRRILRHDATGMGTVLLPRLSTRLLRFLGSFPFTKRSRLPFARTPCFLQRRRQQANLFFKRVDPRLQSPASRTSVGGSLSVHGPNNITYSPDLYLPQFLEAVINDHLDRSYDE
jgi:hypothetical protein